MRAEQRMRAEERRIEERMRREQSKAVPRMRVEQRMRAEQSRAEQRRVGPVLLCSALFYSVLTAEPQCDSMGPV
jgi:hypothetical protein